MCRRRGWGDGRVFGVEALRACRAFGRYLKVSDPDSEKVMLATTDLAWRKAQVHAWMLTVYVVGLAGTHGWFYVGVLLAGVPLLLRQEQSRRALRSLMDETP